MAAGARDSSPGRGSDGNESPSAPSEYLAEFLSAIMRRQYAEALKYCRLILQYEPHNATARGFHPLLQRKLLATGRRGSDSSGSSDDAASCSSPADDSSRSASPASDAAHWDSERSDDADDNGNLPPLPTLDTDDGDAANDNVCSSSGAGGAAPASQDAGGARGAGGEGALRRLRAQFACSIK